jgi:UDP-N-acetylglucosamine:LPS N-acetylglucosamine transferase
MINHNVETCRKKDWTTMVVTKATKSNKKPQKISLYTCHICGLNGHKMTNYPKFTKMKKMFHGKFVTITKVQLLKHKQSL